MSVHTAPRFRVVSALSSLVAAGVLILTGCSSDSETPAPNTSDGAEQTVKITLTEDEISPKGERVKIGAGETVKVEITADHEGSLHVHSTPEQTLDFTNGTVTRELVIDRPGVVEVESHDPDLVILQLQVS